VTWRSQGFLEKPFGGSGLDLAAARPRKNRLRRAPAAKNISAYLCVKAPQLLVV
jgi:hypothetical protein